MKEIIGIGITIGFICLGMGGCVYLCEKGSAARIEAERQTTK